MVSTAERKARNNQCTGRQKIETTQSEKERKRLGEKKKKNEASRSCETITKDLPFMLSEYRKERTKRMGLQKYWKKSQLKTSQIWQDINLHVQEAEQTLKRKKPEEIHTKTHHN